MNFRRNTIVMFRSFNNRWFSKNSVEHLERLESGGFEPLRRYLEKDSKIKTNTQRFKNSETIVNRI